MSQARVAHRVTAASEIQPTQPATRKCNRFEMRRLDGSSSRRKRERGELRHWHKGIEQAAPSLLRSRRQLIWKGDAAVGPCCCHREVCGPRLDNLAARINTHHPTVVTTLHDVANTTIKVRARREAAQLRATARFQSIHGIGQ